MNGTSANSNGHASSSHGPDDPDNPNNINNTSSSFPPSPSSLTPLGLNRHELVRIIVQAMDSLGYPKSARSLEHEARVEAMASDMRTLRDCVLNGRWDSLESVLDSLTVFRTEADARAARFVLYEQKFLELLEARRTADALDCLRNHLTRLSSDPKLFNRLPLLCLCATPEEVRQHAQWPGAGHASRTAVLKKLHRYIPATHLLQENRLENLLCQTIEHQKRLTMFPYTKQNSVSLLEDMEHCEDRVPRNILHRLEGHTDEVWYVQFSHAGEYLASASKDTTVIIWRIRSILDGGCNINNSTNNNSSSNNDNDSNIQQDAPILRKLVGHTEMICSLSWSPDDSRLLSCGHDRTIRLWNVNTGECIRVFEGHSKEITACAWMPDGVHFVSGAADAKIFEWDSNSAEITATYEAGGYVNDVAMARDGRILVATCSDRSVQVFNTATKKQQSIAREAVSITSLFLSPKADFLLACTNSNDYPGVTEPEVQVWDVSEMTIVQKFKGFKQARYVIRGCFGGHNQMFVLCGSEDHLVHIWERTSGNLIDKLKGHKGTVNTVACSEADENLFASGSDDKSVILWGVRQQAPPADPQPTS